MPDANVSAGSWQRLTRAAAKQPARSFVAASGPLLRRCPSVAVYVLPLFIVFFGVRVKGDRQRQRKKRRKRILTARPLILDVSNV